MLKDTFISTGSKCVCYKVSVKQLPRQPAWKYWRRFKVHKTRIFFSNELFSILSKLQATPVTKKEHRERRKNKKFASCYLTVLEIIFQQTESLRSKFLLQTPNYLSPSPSQHHARGIRNTAASRFPNIFTEMSISYPAITAVTPRSASGRVVLSTLLQAATLLPATPGTETGFALLCAKLGSDGCPADSHADLGGFECFGNISSKSHLELQPYKGREPILWVVAKY